MLKVTKVREVHNVMIDKTHVCELCKHVKEKKKRSNLVVYVFQKHMDIGDATISKLLAITDFKVLVVKKPSFPRPIANYQVY